MNPQTFLSNFGYVANAPDGVKSLRQLVMASALAGKFSAPNEDLPSDIQTRLEEARSLHFRSSGKREKPLLFGAPLIQEFEIPVGWQWVRVGQICDLQTGATPSTKRPEFWGGEIPWLASGDINRREIFECDGRITEAGLANSNCKVLPKNSVLIALNGQGKTRATVALLRIPAACNQSLVAMIPFDVRIVTPEYLFLSLRYRYYEIRDVTGQDQRRGLNMSLVSDLSVPLAPLAEQKRILAKVDELMALCDKLESQQQEREQRFPVLSRACHTRFAEAPSQANLNRIFDETGTVSPADVRRTILNLAVQGKLISQNLNDEPAAELLETIAKQKAKLLGTDSLRKTKPCRQFTSDEAPHDIPGTWRWTMLGEITNIGTGSTPSRTEASFWVGGTIPWITSGSTSRSPITKGDELVTPAAVKAHRLRVYPPGTLLVALYGQGKTRGQVAALEIDATINQACAAICALDGIPPMQGYLKLLLEKQYDEMRSLSAGGAQPNLNVQKIKELFVPLAPLAEQRRIVAKVDELMALVDQLEAQQQERNKLAEAFAKACVASFTGTTHLERPEKMKAPKTELVSVVTLGKKSKPDAKALLAKLLSQHKGTLPAKSLWQQSGLTIDAFYQQLKSEIAQGWIARPAEAEMKVLEEG
jgi:type I restriction enzyme S subunit